MWGLGTRLVRDLATLTQRNTWIMATDETSEPAAKRAKLRLQLKNGHECIFTKDLPEHLQVECSICLCVLDNPHMIDCKCGAIFCQLCIQPTLNEKRPCPLCNNPFSLSIPNPSVQRGINSLQVYCSLREAGCEWVGELRALPEHLNDDIRLDNYKSSGCPFLQLKCCYCSKEFKRQYVLEHEKNKCLKRPYKCDTCNEFESTYEAVTTEHVNICPCGLVPCPNDCGVVELQRKNLDDHLATTCPLEMVSCSFSYAGCKEKLPRKDMPAHISDSLVVHMSLQALNHQKELNELKSMHQKELTELKSQIRELRTHLWIMPVNIMLDGFALKKAEGKRWSSHSFYTHLQGYKLYLSVYCNGNRSGAGTHVSVYIHLKSGQYDDELNWPFCHSITIQLLDQKEGKDHHHHTSRFGDASAECTRRVGESWTGNSGWGLGTPCFISQSKLSPKYLVNDSLRFNIF